MSDSPEPLTVHLLRRRWKPHKLRLAQQGEQNATPIRLHRAFSWLQRVEDLVDGQDLDLTLLCRWISFNALYGQWDPQRQEPKPDRDCWRTFLDRILALDADGRIGAILVEHKKLVMSLLDDEHLNRFYWTDPSAKQAAKSKKAKYDAQTWYLESNWAIILDRVIERIHLARCQLAHGAATFGSRINRTSIRRSAIMLGHLLGVILLVLIDHGADEDWGLMCYPPEG